MEVKVFVGNLPWVLKDEDLLSALTDCKGIISCIIERHTDTGRSKGWG
jgi:hypothetical protein